VAASIARIITQTLPRTCCRTAYRNFWAKPNYGAVFCRVASISRTSATPAPVRRPTAD